MEEMNIKNLEKHEDGSVWGVFERQLNEQELELSKASFNSLLTRKEELQTELAGIEDEIVRYNNVFVEESADEPSEEEAEQETEESVDEEVSDEEVSEEVIPEENPYNI